MIAKLVLGDRSQERVRNQQDRERVEAGYVAVAEEPEYSDRDQDLHDTQRHADAAGQFGAHGL